jgi:hypothetical protein
MSASRPLSRLPYVLLAAMSFVSFAGPFVVLATIRGGRDPGWPPDRPVEWGMIGAVLALEVILFFACISAVWWNSPARKMSRFDKRES